MYFFFAEAHHQLNLVEVILDPKSNVINWLILFAALLWGCSKLVPPMLAKREAEIRAALDSAARAREEAKSFLSAQEKRIENAEQDSANIVEEARAVAEQMKAEIEAQTESEINSLHTKLEQSLLNERQIVITEMRAAAAKAAMKLSREFLGSNVTESDKQRLLTQFMQELDSIGGSDMQSFAPGGDKVKSIL